MIEGLQGLLVSLRERERESPSLSLQPSDNCRGTHTRLSPSTSNGSRCIFEHALIASTSILLQPCCHPERRRAHQAASKGTIVKNTTTFIYYIIRGECWWGEHNNQQHDLCLTTTSAPHLPTAWRRLKIDRTLSPQRRVRRRMRISIQQRTTARL